MVLAAALTYLLFSVYLVRSRYRLAFIGVLLALCIGNLVVGLYQVLRDPSFMVIPGYERLRLDGAGGFFDNHNHLGGFLLTVSAFIIALALFGKMGAKMRVVILFLTPLSMLGIAITASRGALLSLGFLLLVFVGLACTSRGVSTSTNSRRSRSSCVALVGIGLVPAALVGWKSLSQARLRQDRGGRGDRRPHHGERCALHQLVARPDQWIDHPLIGQGSRMYDIYSVQHWPGSMNWVHGDPEFAHNDYLQMLGEYGAIGFALLLFFIARASLFRVRNT